MPVRKVAEILDDSPALASVAAVARRTAELQRLYLETVPAELRHASRVGWARHGVLHVAVANSATAAKLRQLAPRILDRYRRAGLEFNVMRVEVQVGHSLRPQARPGRRPLSAEGLACVRRAADELAESPLKAALRRLAEAERRRQRTRSRT
jgi:hypothetical protein